jgi:hypothetical protein
LIVLTFQMTSVGKMSQRMIQCLLLICASVLCATSAAATDTDASVPVLASSSSVFPAADMSLRLSFDLAPPALLAPRGEQCFPFFPNAQFQGAVCGVGNDVVFALLTIN